MKTRNLFNIYLPNPLNTVKVWVFLCLLLNVVPVYADYTTGMAGWWKLDDGSGTTAADSSGNNYTGTLNNAPAWMTTNCADNGCLAFNGTNQYISVPDATNLDFGTGDFTITLWVNINSTASMRMVNKWTGTTGFLFDVNETTSSNNAPGNLRLRMEDGSNSTDVSVPAGISTGIWQFVAVTVHRGSSTGVSFYVNGQQVGTAQSSSATTGSISNTNPLGMGNIPNTNGNYLNGSMNDVRVYNSALSSSEIASVYAAISIPTSLALTTDILTRSAPADMPLTAMVYPGSNVSITNVEFFSTSNGQKTDLGSAQKTSTFGYTTDWSNVPVGAYTLTAVATDNNNITTTSAPINVTVIDRSSPSDSGIANNGLVAWWQFNEGQGFKITDTSGNGYDIMSDFANWSGPGVFAQSYLINSDPNFRTSTSVDLSTTSQVTVSFWALNAVSGILGDTSNANNFSFDVSGGACGANYVMVSAASRSCYSWPAANLNTWHHYVAIFDKVDGNSLYIDGQKQTSSTNTGNGTTQSSAYFTKRPFAFGGSGEVEDVRVYNRSLSSSEVGDLYYLGINANALDSSRPTASITAPGNGATISGSAVVVTATASSSDANITGVQFKVDGSNVGPEITSSPYSTYMDSTQLINGNHILAAEAHDSNGNTSVVREPIVVYNTPPALPLPSTENYKTSLGTLSVNWSSIVDITQSYGAKGDAERLTANTIAGNTTVTIDQDHTLSSADVGKVIEIFQAGAQTGSNPNTYEDLVTTISAVSGPQTATVVTAPGNTLTAARCFIGTNNATAFQNAVNSAEIPIVANTTNNSTTVNITNHPMSNQDIGLTITLPGVEMLPAWKATNPLTTTIVAIGNAHVTLATPAYYGTSTSGTITVNGTPVTISASTGANSTSVYIANVGSKAYNLTSADIGRTITLNSVEPAYTDLITTISSVTDAQHVVVATAPNLTTQALSGTMDTDSGIVLYVPNGQYLFVAARDLVPGFTMSSYADTRAAVNITQAGIKFLGQDRDHTILLGNGAFQDAPCTGSAAGCDNHSVTVERGIIFNITGPNGGSAITSNLPLEFWNLTFDGGVGQGRRHTPGQYWPAIPTTGDWWDTTHHALGQGGSSNRLQLYTAINNCLITHWRGEAVISTVGGNGEFNDIENSSIIDGDASGINLTFTHFYNNNILDNLQIGQEYYEGYGWGESVFSNNTVSNINANGLSLVGALTTNELTSYRVEGNSFDTDVDAIYYAPSARMTVRGNRFVGSVTGMSTNGAGYQPIGAAGDNDHDILIEQNYFNNVNDPFDFSGLYNDLITGLTVRHNIGTGGGSYTMSYDIFSNNYGNHISSNPQNAQPYQPEVINDDGTNNFYFAQLYDSNNGQIQTLSYPSNGSRIQVTWSGGTDPWVLDGDPTTMPTYGPTPITPDPSSGPTTFNTNFNGNVSVPASSDSVATPTLTVWNSSSKAISVYLSKFILTQPVNQTVLPNQTATFTTAAIGNPTYQWEEEAPGATSFSPISGANTSSYTTAATTSADNGTKFACVITYTTPSLVQTTSTVTLTVSNPSPTSTTNTSAYLSILTQPVYQTVIVGQPATFTVAAVVVNQTVTSYQYQWYQMANGSSTWNLIPNATGQTYTTPNTALTDNRSQYKCVVTAGSLTITTNGGSGVMLGVKDQVSTTAVSIPSGQEMLFSWCNINNITNKIGFCNSNSLVGWNVVAGPEAPPTVTLTTSPANGSTVTGPVDINMTATPGSGVSGANISLYVNTYLVSNSNSYTLDNVTSGSFVDSDGTTINNVPGSYIIYAKLTDSHGVTAYSNPSTIIVNPDSVPPSISTQPVNQTVTAGQTATFSVAASSATPMTYQWYSQASGATSFSLINGATSASYTTPMTSSADNGTPFKCVVTNATGTVTSNVATLNTGSSGTTGLNAGCVSGDSSPSIYDAELTAQASVGLISLSSTELQASRVDGGSKVDIYDAFLIAEYSVGVISKFPD